jgi:hypothetical protein
MRLRAFVSAADRRANGVIEKYVGPFRPVAAAWWGRYAPVIGQTLLVCLKVLAYTMYFSLLIMWYAFLAVLLLIGVLFSGRALRRADLLAPLGRSGFGLALPIGRTQRLR